MKVLSFNSHKDKKEQEEGEKYIRYAVWLADGTTFDIDCTDIEIIPESGMIVFLDSAGDEVKLLSILNIKHAITVSPYPDETKQS